MQRQGVDPVPVTFLGVLNACAVAGALDEGRKVHKQIVRGGFESDVFVGSCLVDMYAKCGSIEDALRVFNRMPKQIVVAWNALILGHVKCGQGHKALELFREMQMQGVEPVSITFVAVLNACASVAALEDGRRVHEEIIQRGWESDVFVSNSLVDMYAKCGSMEDAMAMFNKMPARDVFGWSAIILGFVKCGQGQKALDLSKEMLLEGVEPDAVTFVAVLNACSNVLALEEGRRVHERITQSGFESDVFVGSCLVDMYSKCGSVQDAYRVFKKMPAHNAVSWSTMLGGFAMHGNYKEALAHFQEMCQEDIYMDRVTFLSLLSACCHGGLVEEGLHYYDSMSSVHSVSPAVEHLACVVDLLSRAGRLHEAEDLLNTMPYVPNATVWTALLGACRVHGNVEIGESAAKRVLVLDPGDAAGYVLASNVYAAAGQWDASLKFQEQRLEMGSRKDPGRTWIEVDNKMHSFTVDDQVHPQIVQIRDELQRLSREMKEVGYEPDIKSVLQDVEEEEKVFRLCHHSEKLAIAFGLMRTPAGTPIRIFNNSRVCGDCHNATKFISKIAGRTIIVRDAKRFHHFEDGTCSCGDFW